VAPLLRDGTGFWSREHGSWRPSPVAVVSPFNDHAAREIKQYDQYPGPKPGSVKQVYNIQSLAGGAVPSNVVKKKHSLLTWSLPGRVN